MGRMVNFFKNYLPGEKKTKKDYLLALDIGSEFVKALVFKLEKDFFDEEESKARGLILGVGRQRQLLGNMLAGVVANIEGVSLICQKAIQEACQMAKVRPRKAVIGIAGEFIKGASTHFTCQREKPEEVIGLVELQNTIQKAQRKAFDQMRSQLACEICRHEIEIKPINALVTEVRIDGYQVTNPLGFSGKEFFLSIFNVYAPLVHLKAIESIASQLNLELLSIAAEPYALSRSSNFNPSIGAILIDVGGGTTDVALVRQGKVEGIRSFALAGKSFTKRLSQELGLDLPQAEEVKIRHSANQLSQSVQYRIREILRRDSKVWLNGVELTLEEFNQEEYFPPLILLCGGGSLLPNIRNILKKEEIQKIWLNKFPFTQPPQISFLQPGHISDLIDQTSLLKGPEDVTPMALASLTLGIASDEDKILPPILRRVVKIMR